MKWSINPPASLTGDAKKDIENIHEYLTSLDRNLSAMLNDNINTENLAEPLKQKINSIDDINNKIKVFLDIKVLIII